ncbi:Vesicle-associated protein 3-1 [Hibiscus syriacus]|uniref:Vesicle-associated protein 3-1 n=1 Tax=Hibiscus syriacus TaxID=106335 RepID=A0A6A3B0P0_HIBSY|nr:Vesicle-associated protein 3-1 [Hibiscus syriacus]
MRRSIAGVFLPRSTCKVIVTMQAQKEAPPDMQCRDKFLLQSVKVNDGVTANDITAEMLHQYKKGRKRGLQRESLFQMGDVCSLRFCFGARAFTEGLEAQNMSSEARALVTKLTEEKNRAIQQNNKLRQELVRENRP